MDASAHSDETLKQLMNEIPKKFNNYWSQCNNLLVIASILDPRSKFIFIESCFDRAFDMEEGKKRIDDICACLYKLDNEYADAAKVQSYIDSSELTYDLGVQSNVNSISLFHMEKIKFDMDFAQFRSQNSSKRPKRSKLDSYLDDDVLPRLKDKNFNILTW